MSEARQTELIEQSLGKDGYIIITSAEGEVTGNFFFISVKTDAVFTTLTDPSRDTNGAVATGKTYSAGDYFHGNFTVIEVTSGEVWAYKKA
jgi:hypothetical protein